ncbi:LysR family transcriptional regulator [Brevibacillus sp. VP]|uniref:LysR family transcriptional regulator n=1 Tax=unclassified Brevibacillus TaxID=2684853 RepID=UPI000E2E727B|nr:LysR family transcriptional regulator [Brevibacillus sp. VP]RFB31838.1 LysR family transcriptional regulator [Brevibacillus sp. VP]
MEWQQILYFRKVAQTQHITRSAEMLNVSQPALSRAIARLEEELNTPLFERKGRNIVLNQYGELFLKRVERAIQEIEEGKQEIQDLINPDHGKIRIAFLHSLGIEVVPEFIRSFRVQYPQVSFHLHQASMGQIVEQLKTGLIDIALFSMLEPIDEVHWEPLITEELFLIVSKTHPLANRTQIELQEIANEPFICFKQGYGLRTLTDTLCRQAGFTPDITFEGEEIATIAGLVAVELGVSLVPDVNVLDKSKISLLRVLDPACKRTIGLAWKEKRYLSPVARRFISFVKGHYI